MTSPFADVIVDCDTTPLYDQITLAALEFASVCVMQLTPNRKGFEFRESQNAWLTNADIYDGQKYLTVAAPVMPYTPMAEVRARFGGFVAELPWAQEIDERMMAGELLTQCKSLAGVRYEQAVKGLAAEILHRGEEADG